MAEGVRYASDEADANGRYPPPPVELLDLGYVERFGVRAVFGRDELSAGEIRRMLFAENVVLAYTARKRSGDWGAWAQQNPRADDLLKRVEMAIHGTD